MLTDHDALSISALLEAAEDARVRKDRARAIALIEAVYAILDGESVTPPPDDSARTARF